MTPLYITKPVLPPLPDLNELLASVWASQRVTNEGPLHDRLEARLAERLGVPVAKLFSSGTAALQGAMLSKRFPQGGEVITTPLTFPATAHAITACGLKPVFADIDPVTLTLDPRTVARAITPKTVAVLPVHVYGTICDDAALRALCHAHGLCLIYDAAHAFGARKGATDVAALGDMSVFSLHATKPFNTIEGGLVTTTDAELGERLRQARNFGIESEDAVHSVGINGKLSEMHAAVGLLNFNGYEAEKAERRMLRRKYLEIFAPFPGITPQVFQPDVEQSEHYFMVRIDPERHGASRDDIYRRLKRKNIFSRRYFWPICTDYDCYRSETIVSLERTPVAERVKATLLCMPFHSGVTDAHLAVIRQVVRASEHCPQPG